MILISHRGNTTGKLENWENEPTYIQQAINKGYNVEVDVWYKDNIFWLGHDKPEYFIQFDWFEKRWDKLWIHCKNVEALVFFTNISHKGKPKQFQYFYHKDDIATLTSTCWIWAYPGNQPIKNSIAVLPELYNDDVTKCYGICSDYIENYK
jgi:hypothetical protein